MEARRVIGIDGFSMQFPANHSHLIEHDFLLFHNFFYVSQE